MTVGEAAVVKHLQENVEHIRVGLFHLVEQHDGVGAAADGLGELATLVVANVSGRGTDEAGDGVFLRVFAHVNANHGALIIEHEFGQGFSEFRLAHTGGAEEQEGTHGPIGVRNPGAGTPNRIGDGLHRVELADHPFAQFSLHVEEFFGFAFKHFAGGDTGPGGHDLGDGIGGDFLGEHCGRQGLLFQLLQLFLQLGDGAIAELGNLAVVAVAFGDFGCLTHLFQFFFHAPHLVDGGLFIIPPCLEFAQAFALVGEFFPQFDQAVVGGGVGFFGQCHFFDFEAADDAFQFVDFLW